MKEFTPTILQLFISNGYNYVRYQNMEHFAFLRPAKEEGEATEDIYYIEITDEEVTQMASGVDGFRFYVMDQDLIGIEIK